MTRTNCIVVAIAMVFGLSAAALGQSFEERIKQVRQQRLSDRSAPEEGVVDGLPIKTRMSSLIKNVDLDEVEGRRAFQWWSTTTGIPLVINWEALQFEGANPDTPVSLKMNFIPSSRMLELLLKQVAPGIDMVYEITPWYVEVLTKQEANKKTIVRIYDVSDLILTIPNFTNAPQMDLENALDSGTRNGSGGSGGRGGSGSSRGGGSSGEGIFVNNDDEDEEPEEEFSRTERGEMIVDLIRSTIEPEIWQATFGGPASIRFYDGKLIVNAPKYVHEQIGTPVRTRPRGGVTRAGTRSTRSDSARTPYSGAPRRNGNVSAVIPSGR